VVVVGKGSGYPRMLSPLPLPSLEWVLVHLSV
jgi:hypothetical protein